MADAQLDVDLKSAASKAFEEARLLVTETLTTARVPSVSTRIIYILSDYCNVPPPPQNAKCSIIRI